MRRVPWVVLAVVSLVFATVSASTPRNALGGGSGDPVLQAIAHQLDLRAESLAVVVVAGGRTRTAYFRSSPTTVYELGSVSKALTGLLIADSAARGEVRLDQRLGACLNLGASPAAGVVLKDVATHTSRLPRDLARGGGPWFSNFTGKGVDALEADARAATLGAPGFVYSNLGGSLVGWCAAKAAGMTYADLVTTRLFAPLSMTGSAAQVTPMSTGGHNADGVAQEPWLLDGYAPMGGLVSTPQEMAALLRAILDGTAPGLAALEPVLQLSDGHFEGLLWDVHAYGTGRMLAAHAGGTPGYSSYIAVDRASGIAVVVLADGKTNVQALGERLMTTPLG